jgi:hypothetical protein
MKPYFVLFVFLLSSCMDNANDPPLKSEYVFSRIEGGLSTCVKGVCRTQDIQNTHEYGERMDSAQGLQFPGIMPKISRHDGIYYLDFVASKITPEMQVPCADSKTDLLACVWGEDTLTLAVSPGKLEIPHYVIRGYQQETFFEFAGTGERKLDDHIDSLLSGGSYDSILLFKGNYLYE